jgi:membrane peptidoglycan carboxypeptidase
MFRSGHRTLYFLAAAALLCGLAVVLLARELVIDLPDPAQPLRHAGTPSILITDRHGRTLYEVIDPNGSKYQPLPLSAIPLACQQATIATEDRRFYYHPGVDPVALTRALWQNWTTGHTVSGGSTLTQQLARNLYLGRDERTERSIRRKLREAWLAWRLERHFGKPQILALYLNTTFYGHFATGLEAAAQGYFGSHASDLDLAQCALLAGLPQYPAGYNPIENPEAARARQAVVLDLMVKDGYITSEQAAEASAERLAFASTPFPIEAPHFVMWVQNQLGSLLPPERLAELNLAQGGLRVETTLDLDWQRQAEAIVARRLAQVRPCAAVLAGATPGVDCDPEAGSERRVDDAALVALDPATGAVRAMVGSAGYFNQEISGAVNAALSLRQPGSAIKPLTYAAAFDPQRAAHGGQEPWTPATLIADIRTVFTTAEDQPYVPNNYDMRYHGPVTARAALANSYNIPAVKTLDHIGLPALIDQAHRQGIDWLANLPTANATSDAGAALTGPPTPPAAGQGQTYGLALTLGGGEVRLLDLTAAYAAFANGGRRVTPYAISRIATLDGQVLLDASAPGDGQETAPAGNIYAAISVTLPYPQPPVPVLDPRVAYLITSILSDQEARLPTFGPGNVLEIGRPAAAKTGTTTDWRDNWTIGYTPDLVAGVWAGNADNAPMMDISGITGAGPIWHDFMTTVLRGTPAAPFPRPDGLIQREVCADSGLLPADESAPGSGSSVVPCPNRRLEWFIAGTEPRQVDLMHQRIGIDVRTGEAATAATPPEAIHYDTFWILPDEYQDWARANHVPQPVSRGTLAVGQGSQTEGVQGSVQASGPAGSSGDRMAQTNGQAAAGTQALSGSRGSAGPALVLVSPEPNRAYRVDPVLPANAQQVPVVARPGAELVARGATISLLVDGSLLAAIAGPDYAAWWRLDPGPHTFEAVARGPGGEEIRSAPVHITVSMGTGAAR